MFFLGFSSEQKKITNVQNMCVCVCVKKTKECGTEKKWKGKIVHKSAYIKHFLGEFKKFIIFNISVCVCVRASVLEQTNECLSEWWVIFHIPHTNTHTNVPAATTTIAL